MNVLEAAIKTGNNIPPKNEVSRKKLTVCSVAGSAIGIAGAVAGVYALAKNKNPLVSLKNLSYSEKDVLMIGAGSVIGGLTGGLIADKNKKNVRPKLREASQQYLGNMVCPIGLLAFTNHILEKTNFSLPKIASSSKAANIVNNILGVLPKFVGTVASLVLGMEIGNKIMNKFNNKVFKEEVKHDIHAEDYLVHADDLCLAANMLLKDVESISAVTSKILPATFIIAGSKTGMQQQEK